MRKRTISLVAILVAAGAVWLNNTSLLSSRPAGTPSVLAHRGLAQDFDRTNLGSETCTAARMLTPRHCFLENTISSMEAAFALDADALELDVHPTTDGKFAVFHDWTLDCRTDGKGETRSHAMSELKTLDIGYGYTADGGKTFPFRGKSVGMMPSLDEVLQRFPNRRFNINIKSNDPKEGEMLAAWLATLTPAERANLTVYGGDRPIEAVKAALPDMHTLSRASLTRCILRYAALGWSGYVPDACRQGTLLIPFNVAKWMCGWPDRFLDRMDSVGSRVDLLGPYSGGISTDALDLVMPAVKRRFGPPA
ncbi:glycerophosphodiester phosphodiesterase family protein [Mesorhizobium sp. ISC25]|uniref:glycerophosphodiester phosphodiesterase family protein n=1 Tax=Mesorhizobium sp. ISC25 TaxID=3077335 RepID=UPI0035D552F6